MDPNNPNFRQQFSGFSDDFLTNPEFQLLLQRTGNMSSRPPPLHQTPTEVPLQNPANEDRTPETDLGSNTLFDESEEESVPETPQYPPPPVRLLEPNQVPARATRIWSVAEDEALIGLYLQISEDAIKSTSQKATSLWRNVHAAYQTLHTQKPHIIPSRPIKSLTSHWRRLAADTLQWISCYDEASRLPEGGSGYNEADRIKSAAKLFHVAQGRNFTFPHAIEMLNKDPKWRPKLRWSMSLKERKAACDAEEEGSAGSGKRSRDDVEDETPTDGFSSGGLQRPEGVKKEKAKRKGKAVATESGSSELSERVKEFATIHEREAILKEERIKIEKDKEQRKREELDIHKMKTWFDMVQALKNSPTPLNPEEESYKNFLLGKLQGL
ncbi:glutathione S-transferase T3-like [Chenopodium quinoa]|uniref:glutathione S-transferase T3-like n=1 Tax=Chenopodium quinoa TaxID=63459 RepID=UPI000B76F75E|nr:glutathione S-transferase T3-like [Chenopodium quinoa]